MFTLDLCNNRIDRHHSRFPEAELETVNRLVLGRPLMERHDLTGSLPRGTFFRSQLHRDGATVSVRPDASGAGAQQPIQACHRGSIVVPCAPREEAPSAAKPIAANHFDVLVMCMPSEPDDEPSRNSGSRQVNRGESGEVDAEIGLAEEIARLRRQREPVVQVPVHATGNLSTLAPVG